MSGERSPPTIGLFNPTRSRRRSHQHTRRQSRQGTLGPITLTAVLKVAKKVFWQLCSYSSPPGLFFAPKVPKCSATTLLLETKWRPQGDALTSKCKRLIMASCCQNLS